MFVDPLTVAAAALAWLIPSARGRLTSALPETTKRRRMFKYQVLPQYKKASQKISSHCHAKLKYAYDRFEEFVDLLSCIEVEIHDEKSLNEHFAKGKEQIKEAAPLLRSAYKGAFSAFTDLENFKDYERVQAYNLAFTCQIYLHFEDIQMLEKSFNRLLEQMYLDQHLKGHIKKYLQDKDGYSLKYLSKVTPSSYSKKTIFALQNIIKELKKIVPEICDGKHKDVEKRLLDAISKPVHLKRKYHRFFTSDWREDEKRLVEEKILMMAAALLENHSNWMIETTSESKITSNNLLITEPAHICTTGLVGSDLFCMDNENSRGIVYDSKNSRFVFIKLSSKENGSQISEVTFDWPEFIHGNAKCVQIFLHSSDSHVETSSILALITEQVAASNKYRIHLLSLEVSDLAAILLDNYLLEEDLYESHSQIEPHLIQGSSGQIWCTAVQKNLQSTAIKIYKVIDKCQCEEIPRISVSLDGLWTSPFLTNDFIGFLPLHTEELKLKCDRMLTVNLDGSQKTKMVTLSSGIGDCPPLFETKWSQPRAVSEDSIAVYIFKEKEKTGEIWVLNCKENVWKMCIKLEEKHTICNQICLDSSGQFKLSLHGKCGNESCIDGAHFYLFDLSAIVKGTGTISQALKGTETISNIGSKSHSEGDLMSFNSSSASVDSGGDFWRETSVEASSFLAIDSMAKQRNGVAVVAQGVHLYAVGGKEGDGSTSLNSCERYDPLRNEWEPIASMIQRRSGAGLASLDGYLYVIGGFDGNVALSSCERYCPKDDKWTMLPPMSYPRGGVGAAALFGKLYAIGGFDGKLCLDTVDTYDPQTNQWTLGLL